MDRQKIGIDVKKDASQASSKNYFNEVDVSGKPKLVQKLLESIISVSLFFIFFGVPLFFIGLTYQGISFEKQIYFYFWLLLAVIAWAVRGVISGEMKIRRTPLDLPIVIFWFVYLLSTVFSVDHWHSLWGFFRDPSRGFVGVTMLILGYFLIMSNFNPKRLKIMLWAVISSGVALSVLTLIQIMGLKWLPGKMLAVMPMGLTGSLSGTAAWLAILLPVYIVTIFMLRESSGEKTKKNSLTFLLGLFTLINIFLLFALYNYVPWIALLLGMGFLLIYMLSRIIRPIEAWTWFPMAIFVAVMVIVMAGSFKIARVDLPSDITPTLKTSWSVAYNSLHDKAILGSGPATYGYDFSLYHSQSLNDSPFYNLRFYQGTGLLMEAIPTVGVLGSLALLLILFSFLSVALYFLTTGKEKNKIYSLGLFSATLMLLIFAFTSRIEGALIIAGFFLATLTLAVIFWESGAEENYLNLSLKASPKYALALAFIFMVVTAGVAYAFVFIGKTFLADVQVGKSVQETETIDDGSIARMINAVNLNGKEGMYFTVLGQDYMFLANKEILKNEKDRSQDLVRNYLSNSIVAAAAGRDLMKDDVLAVESLAQIYENASLYDATDLNLALDTYKRASELEPHNPNYFVKMGQMKISSINTAQDENGKKQLINEAKDLFQKAVDEKKDFAPAYYQLSLAKEALGDMDGAIQDMGQAFAYDNSNISYAFNLGRLYQTRGGDDDNKIAENLFKQILGVNDNEINTHFSLGLLYEKENRKDEAISEYKKVLGLLSSSQASALSGTEETKTKIQKMIDNVQNGISNLNSTSPAPAVENQAAGKPAQPEVAQ
jgi:tetratricopeptide (TPR) repeat protein